MAYAVHQRPLPISSKLTTFTIKYSVMATVRVTPKHVDSLLLELADIAASWIVFVGQLNLPQARINQIERDVPPGDRRSVECLRAALLQWVSISDNPTYETVITALRSPVLKEAVLAQRVEEFAKRIQGMFYH